MGGLFEKKSLADYGPSKTRMPSGTNSEHLHISQPENWQTLLQPNWS